MYIWRVVVHLLSKPLKNIDKEVYFSVKWQVGNLLLKNELLGRNFSVIVTKGGKQLHCRITLL